MTNHIQKYQRFLLLHGALILLMGFVLGFGFLFFLAGEIALWPIPGKIDYQMPGTYDAWRMAHMECITNGIMLWVLAALLPALSSIFKSLRWIAYMAAIISWTIVVASSIDPFFPEARGLTFNADTNAASDVAFFLFYPGVMLSFVLVIAIIIAILRSEPIED